MKEGNYVSCKKWIFICLWLEQLLEQNDFVGIKLSATEIWTWEAFENSCRNFLENKKAENYSEIAQDLISSYCAMGCNMSAVMHVLGSVM